MIKDIFEKNRIQYQEKEIPQKLFDMAKNIGIRNYLSYMGKDIFLYQTSSGVARTSLYSVDNIMEEVFDDYNLPCADNGYLIIGNGPNGDLLCVNCMTGFVGYAFHDDLWEENFDDFMDIYIELPLTIEQFILLALGNEDTYPCDGYMAEEYVNERK